MYKVKEFVQWALTHAKAESVPVGAELALSHGECGREPWHYLFGSVRVRTDAATLERYFENYYKTKLSRERYDQLTGGWRSDGFATDCQGLLDAFLTYEKGEPTDINADANYRLWCSEASKGRIDGINRPFVIGEAVFRSNAGGKMTHVGWICGFDNRGEPLVVEARGIAYGVVVTQLSERDFTHRGLMTAKFDYNSDYVEENGEKPEEEEMNAQGLSFELQNPMARGEVYRAMQSVLNLAGYRDGSGKLLEEDGKWGAKSVEAFGALLEAHRALSAPQSDENGESMPVVLSLSGLRVTVERA